jgi:hypothetical protein
MKNAIFTLAALLLSTQAFASQVCEEKVSPDAYCSETTSETGARTNRDLAGSQPDEQKAQQKHGKAMADDILGIADQSTTITIDRLGHDDLADQIAN